MNEMNISYKDAKIFVNNFFDFIKKNSLEHTLKISNFGTFSMKITRERIGRNPKTKETYIIPTMKKLSFKPSSGIKKKIN